MDKERIENAASAFALKELEGVATPAIGCNVLLDGAISQHSYDVIVAALTADDSYRGGVNEAELIVEMAKALRDKEFPYRYTKNELTAVGIYRSNCEALLPVLRPYLRPTQATGEVVAKLETSIAEAEDKLYNKADLRLATLFSADWQCVHSLVRNAKELIDALQTPPGGTEGGGE